MSEFINNKEKRIKELLEFSRGIINDEDGFALVQKYKETLDNITPYDMFEMENRQLQMRIKPQQIKDKIEKIMNVIYSSLKNYNWEKPEKGHPLYNLIQENRELEKILHQIKLSIQKKNFSKFSENINKLPNFNNHYIRKENILFPYLEKALSNHLPLQVMWSLHDDIRKKWKTIVKIIDEEKQFCQVIYEQIGELFFLMYGMIFKEDLVVFPIAMESISKLDWQKMIHQEFEIGFSYIDVPVVNKAKLSEKTDEMDSLKQIFFKVETGELSHNQIEIIFNSLPIDITFIDKNDEVRYFSSPKDRFFPRSPAIIGRKVQNCHPPESVHIVEKILNSFKSGEKEKAEFHIQMRGKFIQIRYFALRDDDNKYMGTLEVSQDITEIRKLDGEKRLLD
ncbi:MAG: PAS domain-containing protein [Candidatus Cloacimonetes bacterium]|nr:PAS domain-containing protein [Candidatus Cloacimonadota bacterium]